MMPENLLTLDRNERSESRETMTSLNSSDDGYGPYRGQGGYKAAVSGPYSFQDEDKTRTGIPRRDPVMAARKSRNWVLSALVSLALVLVTWPATFGIRATSLKESKPNLAVAASTEPPRQSTNFSTAVQWDNYSLFLNDQRIFLQ